MGTKKKKKVYKSKHYITLGEKKPSNPSSEWRENDLNTAHVAFL